MGRQIIPVKMGMGIMPGRESRLHLGVVGRVGMQVIHGVMSVFFSMTLLVLARLGSGVRRTTGPGFGFVSR